MASKTSSQATRDNPYFDPDNEVIEFFLIALSSFFDSVEYVHA
jgi:hypothetical protein